MDRALWLLFTFVVTMIYVVSGQSKEAVVYTGNNQFAIDLYKALAKTSPDGTNIVTSPFSAHAALSMVYQGSSGTTETLLKNILLFGDKNTTASGYKDVLNHLNHSENIHLSVANKIFLQKDYKLKDSFNSVIHESYNSDNEVVDFQQNEQAAHAINSWVEGKTNEKIKNLFESKDFNPYTRLVLVNALYLKAKWQFPFYNENLTKKGDFHVTNSKTVKVPMMVRQDGFNLNFDNEFNATVLELPLENTDFSMLIIMPNSFDGIKQLETKITPRDISQIVRSLKKESFYTILFPKFKVEQKFDMKAVLFEIGLGELFDEKKCDLSQMADGGELFVHKAVQKVYINVEESGLEAAAATGVAIGERFPSRELKFDRPFFFAIIEKRTHNVNVLFAGRISDPSETSSPTPVAD